MTEQVLHPGILLQGGKYRILGLLGQGGFGITYEAEQVALGRNVAIKEFFMKGACERADDTASITIPTKENRPLVDRFKDKFIREARLIAAMDHPHIVKIFDVFEENGTAYYVMENIQGGSLSKAVKIDGPLPESVAIEYIKQIGEALAFIHEQNVLHLDVKPSNILLRKEISPRASLGRNDKRTTGQAVLIDFGISKHYDEAGQQTSSTPVGISEGYAPLEQYRSGDISFFKPATDVYSLGATLYYLVSGDVPPAASDVLAIGVKRPLLVSDTVWNAISSAMQPRPADRPQSIDEFLNLLSGKHAAATPKATPASDEGTVIAPVSAGHSPVIAGLSPVISSGGRKAGVEKSQKSKKTIWLSLIVAAAVAALIGIFILGGKTPENATIGPDSTMVTNNGSGTSNSTGINNGHEWVDLGLSVKWATTNVGATSPSEYGNYYAWGETSPKSSYDWVNYKYLSSGDASSNVIFSKYNTKRETGNIDNKTRLDLSDDAARHNWGGNWRTPTDAEWKELKTKCTWKWTTQNGHAGYKVSASNGNSIFFPAAGYYSESKLNASNKECNYWSSTLATESPWIADYQLFTSDGIYWYYDGCRFYGRTIRPVLDSNKTNDSKKTGSVKITSTPSDATIYIDGKSTGLKTPNVVENLTVGSHTVKLMLDGYKDATGSVTITSEKRASFSKALEAKPAPQPVQSVETTIGTGTINGHEWVDLGLSVKWATTNVGASTPEAYGNYYAWAEISTKNSYTVSNTKYCLGSSKDFSKYTSSDGITRLEMSDDAARQNWGGSWRMPTDTEWKELSTLCKWVWTSQNGINGYKITAKNGRSIFLPAVGYQKGDRSFYVGTSGYYWSSSVYANKPYLARGIGFGSSGVSSKISDRQNGQSVRPVIE